MPGITPWFGKIFAATPVRDVAQIKVPVSLSNVLALRDRPAETLEQVYAIGSPPGEDLQSSVTQGNVIGISTATLVGASSQNVNLVVPISSAIERLNLTVSAGPTGQETEQGRQGARACGA